MQFQDDIEFQIYGAMQGLEKAFNLVQGKLTREKLHRRAGEGRDPGRHRPRRRVKGGSRFGGTSAFALKANCATRQYETVKQYLK